MISLNFGQRSSTFLLLLFVKSAWKRSTLLQTLGRDRSSLERPYRFSYYNFDSSQIENELLRLRYCRILRLLGILQGEFSVYSTHSPIPDVTRSLSPFLAFFWKFLNDFVFSVCSIRYDRSSYGSGGAIDPKRHERIGVIVPSIEAFPHSCALYIRFV